MHKFSGLFKKDIVLYTEVSKGRAT